MRALIRKCDDREVSTILEVINDAADAYRGVIPDDGWKEPYMPESKLRDEIDDGVVFWGYYRGRELVGVMGIQHVLDVTLIRHAYVRSLRRRKGIGSQLLEYLLKCNGDAVSRDDLLRRVWGLSDSVQTRTVDMFVSRLRKLLELDPSQPKHLVSVRGVGYRLII